MTTILLTGATGFVGGAVLAALLRRREPLRVLVLTRAADALQAVSRLRDSVARFAEPGRNDYHWQSCDTLIGDLTEPGTLRDPRLDDVTHVLHLAANTSFRSVSGVRATNIGGTEALAQRMRRVSGLARILHVGTAFACGAGAPSIVHEDDYPQRDAPHLVEYTRSKAEAELLLERMMPELPLVVARPSIVVGHTRLGCGPSASIFWYYRAVDLLRRVPVPLDTRKDIIPVDYAADALLHLLLQPALCYRRYHVSAGMAGAVSWREMAQVFARYHGPRCDTPYRVVDHATLCRERGRIRAFVGPGDEERMLRALEPFFRLSACGAEVFDNGRLLAAGMPAPPRFTDYLPACIERPAHRSVHEQLHDDA
jgi:nucleoside-diphosphate-sugar epimerase